MPPRVDDRRAAGYTLADSLDNGTRSLIPAVERRALTVKLPARLAGVVLAGSVAIAAGGCAVVNKVTETVESQSDEFGPEITAIDLTNLVGTIKITGGDRLVVKRELTQQTTRKSQAEVVKEGGTLRLTGTCAGAGGDCAVDWDIALPGGVTVKVVNKTGSITLNAVAAKEIEARTKLGEVVVGATGEFDRLAAHTEGGEVTVTVPGGRSYQVTTKVKERLGKATVEVPNGPGPRIEVGSDRGDVTVRHT